MYSGLNTNVKDIFPSQIRKHMTNFNSLSEKSVQNVFIGRGARVVYVRFSHKRFDRNIYCRAKTLSDNSNYCHFEFLGSIERQFNLESIFFMKKMIIPTLNR